MVSSQGKTLREGFPGEWNRRLERFRFAVYRTYGPVALESVPGRISIISKEIALFYNPTRLRRPEERVGTLSNAALPPPSTDAAEADDVIVSSLRRGDERAIPGGVRHAGPRSGCGAPDDGGLTPQGARESPSALTGALTTT